MKQLQNNFTTPEQSKRLLEIGVPADSADCYIDNRKDEISFGEVFVRHNLLLNEKQFIPLINGETIIPCWSVGRLIEILCKCGIHYVDDGNLVFNFKQGRLNDIVGAFVDALEYNCKDGCIDFSKLED